MNGSRWIIAFAAVLVLGVVNVSIAHKEGIAAHGEVVLLDLAPVDPRSLMQGDYMALRFAIASGLMPPATQGHGVQEGEILYAPITIDEHRVAKLAGPGDTTAYRLRYRIRNGQPWIGTNAFFFEEGTAEHYAGARYGEFRLDAATGEAVLVGLRDKGLNPMH
jgi:uncharacterized membrane-anchored protein